MPPKVAVMVPSATADRAGTPAASALPVPDDGEEREPRASAQSRAAPAHPPSKMATRRGPEAKRSRRHHQADEYVGRIPDPEDRAAADQEVPQGAAADPRHCGQQGEPERVHALAGRHQRARQGEDRHADGFDAEGPKPSRQLTEERCPPLACRCWRPSGRPWRRRRGPGAARGRRST